ncbi:hypothetical protein P691DRAFT_796943 [Macrolepiota fuliginosa MF-IS2]|uniref:GOLD domain-containing protein n=1 Tax=Macrolepiota fuliginosa MF-IS2 TaxID=1400762 RepID=A0A9P5X3R7_9AGAR|nr:hypothetical protein P691DRAFT_796943 [Macrolepiota fuliginosa MF-IS2]
MHTLCLSFLPVHTIKFSLQVLHYPPPKCIWNAAHAKPLVDIDIVELSQQKNVYLSKRRIKAKSRLAITTHGKGEVGICLKNYMEDMPYDKASKLSAVIDLDVDIGADAVDYNILQCNCEPESLLSLETEMHKLGGEVKEILDELEYLKRREERFTSTNSMSLYYRGLSIFNTSTQPRRTSVQNFAWSSILSLAALGVWQILHLRAYFKRKYLID